MVVGVVTASPTLTWLRRQYGGRLPARLSMSLSRKVAAELDAAMGEDTITEGILADLDERMRPALLESLDARMAPALMDVERDQRARAVEAFHADAAARGAWHHTPEGVRAIVAAAGPAGLVASAGGGQRVRVQVRSGRVWVAVGPKAWRVVAPPAGLVAAARPSALRQARRAAPSKPKVAADAQRARTTGQRLSDGSVCVTSRASVAERVAAIRAREAQA